MFDDTADTVAALVDRICAASRDENRAAGARLVAIGELDLARLRESGDCESFATGTWEAVSAEVAAALRISQGLASSYLGYSRAMRTRLPLVGAALVAGDITYWMFQMIVYRTDLITDPDVLAAIDKELAAKVSRWPSMTHARLAAHVDQVVARVDRDAVRRTRERKADREFSIWDSGNGLTEVSGRLVTTDAHAVDARLDALAATVCANDPRTRKQRRADAMGALAAGAQRLGCRCGRQDCAAGAPRVPSAVVIHVVANQSSLDGTPPTAGSMIGADALLPAELIAELAVSAKLHPLVHPGDAQPEPGYAPSQALADFVRCRDLTCRFPGCDLAAVGCDVDHTTPYGQGGVTHASNLKCLCRLHHSVKTFWRWQDKQLPDGTVIWTSPSGHTYVTTPGSALLFPSLCVPTGELTAPRPARTDPCTDRTTMMPKRRRTRAQNRASYIAAERRQNHQALEAQAAQQTTSQGLPPPREDPDEPPPF